ncbi:hypothetical protein GALMADRAFT_248867 [Galerina marginata CBS 339.88]|uniref:Minichromosome loss protein Mcl1 middle region domain-containing protein n=1 Tax=Galerina marginata (strain CBS 339.88) TaxID=685588 RepID=A0A067SYA5_GALM3|nr:hypothetical protein GALMADRAFT_248867 [Galerina marginata CBS 339.88]
MADKLAINTHGKGHTCMAFSKDGSRAFTGGKNAVIRIWTVSEGPEHEPAFVEDSGDAITSLATADDGWISGCLDGEARRYSRFNSEMDTVVTSFVSPIRCVAIDPTDRRIAVTSDEPKVKVVELEDTERIVMLEGYASGVRSATWHPSSTLLATCTSDGKIVIWNVAAEKPFIEKTLEGLIPAVKDSESPEFSYDCSAVWHTSGQYFFVATNGHEIVTISRDDWTKTSTFSDKNVSGAVTALALSPNGVYLASASQSRVHIWSTQTRRVITSQIGKPGSSITQLAWSPNENLLAWTDSDGAFTRWRKPISDNFPDPVKGSMATNGAATIPVKPKTGLDLFADDTEQVTTGEKEDDDVDLDDDIADIDDGWIVDDMDGALNAPPAEEKGGRNGLVKEMVSITQAQPPFQPGSTPMENKKRYLAYNMVGVIEVTDQDTHNIVNVEFFDRSLRKGYHFTDNFKHDLGYLGERGAVFACPPENDHPAEVLFKPYSNWKANDWTYTLSKKGIKCLGIAAGALPLNSRNSADVELQGYGNIVVATTENDLTFLSGTGRERRIMALGGDFVTMVASEEWVFVIHRAGSTTIDGSQNLSYSIINFEDFTVRQRDVLPVPKGHTLKWIGVTDQGAPAMFDTTGCVHILTKHRIPHHASWARVMDTNTLERRQGKDESYWPVGITESNFMCLILKGRQEHPAFPRPLIQELPMRIPFRQNSPQEETIEREALHVQIAFDSLDDELTTDDIISREKAMDKELIQLIQGACKAGNAPRAIELTRLLHQIATLDAAMKIADFYHLVGLKEKMGMVKADREENEDRLHSARNKRRRWLKQEPPLRQLAEAPAASSSRFDPLGDFRPPPVIERPGMARVTAPRIETTRFTSHTPSSRTPERASWNDSAPRSPPSTDSKRKRDDLDESFPTSDISMPPPKQKPNPFARKANQDSNKNPFARKLDASKTIQKSESFFDKVDAAESETVPRKRPGAGNGKDAATLKGKDRKEGPKQATLFGMLPKADKVSRPKKQPDTAPPTADTQETQIDSQMTDVTTVETETQEESQQRVGSPDWDETQLVDAGDESSMITSEL